ncbi:MAG: hypothetical protein R2834_20275 [Rhodothermales bacterium]
MRNTVLISIFVACLVAVGAGCDVFSGNEDAGVVTLSGLVVDAATSEPVVGAFLQIQPQGLLEETDANGRYSVDVDIDSTMNVTIIASKSGYSNTSTTVLAVANREIDVATIRMSPTSSGTDQGGRESGRGSNILLLNQSTDVIGVRESGSTEVAEVVFQVTDSLGRPINLDNAITINFSFGVDPGGDAFIFPESGVTNNDGVVRTNVSSGTRAGVIQLVATANVGGRTIRSLPVNLTVHGGLPDDNHFSIGMTLNEPCWRIINFQSRVVGVIGDQYGNPVRPGTSVYFTTTGGVIEGSAQTDALGVVGVTKVSGAPHPVHPTFGPGYGIITASTADRNQQQITDDAVFLCSGTANIFVPPSQGALVVSRAYQFFVYDENQNPLSQGSTITVRASGENVAAFGNTDVTLSDVLFGGTGITEFSFGIQNGGAVDDMGNLLPEKIEAVTIKVAGPNGNAERVILANGAVLKRDEFGKLVPVY